jgi:hypothetical protein
LNLLDLIQQWKPDFHKCIQRNGWDTSIEDIGPVRTVKEPTEAFSIEEKEMVRYFILHGINDLTVREDRVFQTGVADRIARVFSDRFESVN